MSDLNQMLAQALTHHRAGRADQAAPLYRAVLERRPGEVAALNGLAVIRAEAGDLDSAIALIRRAADAKPDARAYRFNLGVMLHNAGRHQEAEEVFAAGAAAFGDPAFHARRGRSLIALRRWAPAVDALTVAVDAQGDQAAADVLADLSAALIGLRRLDDAARMAERAALKDPDNAPARRALALSLLQRGDAAGALQQIDYALQLTPTYVDALVTRGQIRTRLHDLDGAETDFTVALSLAPRAAEPFAGRVGLRVSQGRLGDALFDIEMAVGLKPTAADFRVNRARLLHALGRSDDAAEELETALELAPGDEGARQLMQEILRRRLAPTLGAPPRVAAD